MTHTKFTHGPHNKVEIKEVPSDYLRFKVINNGKQVGEHAVEETALQQKTKILTPLPIPKHKGRLLI